MPERMAVERVCEAMLLEGSKVREEREAFVELALSVHTDDREYMFCSDAMIAQLGIIDEADRALEAELGAEARAEQEAAE
jgi:hypothetical protein